MAWPQVLRLPWDELLQTVAAGQEIGAAEGLAGMIEQLVAAAAET